jgi:hypothetical protein
MNKGQRIRSLPFIIFLIRLSQNRNIWLLKDFSHIPAYLLYVFADNSCDLAGYFFDNTKNDFKKQSAKNKSIFENL